MRRPELRALRASRARRVMRAIGASAALFSVFTVACGSSDDGGGGRDREEDAGQAADAAPDGPLLEADSAADGPVATDAGADSADAAPDVVTASHYCAALSPKPKFCDDFDDGDLEDDWDVATVVTGSAIDLDTTQSSSAPASFAVHTPVLSAASTANAHLRTTVLGAVTHVKLSVSALFPTVTFDEGVIAIATLDVSSNHYFTLSLRDDDAVPAASLEEFVGATMTRHVLTALPPAGTWTRIGIDLDFVSGEATVTFDAQKALDAEPIAAIPGTEATIRVGGVYVVGPAAPFEARFDDVVLDF